MNELKNMCVNRSCGKTIRKAGLIKNYSKHPKGAMPYLTSYSTALCSKCRELMSKKREIYVTCTVCKEAILVKHTTGGVKLTCSETCRKERHSILCKESYRETHPLKTNKCLTCNTLFTGNKKYCSRLCYPSIGSTWFKIQRFEISKKRLKDIGYEI